MQHPFKLLIVRSNRTGPTTLTKINKMNEVTYKKTDLKRKGDIYIDADGDLYILSSVCHNDKYYYVAVCLRDGTCWGAINKDAEKAVQGLEFVQSNTRITIG